MDELRNRKVIHGLLTAIKEKVKQISSPVRVMEVCGTHTMTIHHFGLKDMLKDAGVEMLSGPGCPVCITPDEYHEAAIGLVKKNENFILATFGDMTRVPTSLGSLQTTVAAKNSVIKIVYSPFEALEIAKNNQSKEVVFFGVGFETTIPGIVLSVREASDKKIKNFSILSAFWTIPPPLKAIVASDSSINGFIYPGHVSAIIGKAPYTFIADDFNIAGAIAGFEPVDVLLAIKSIVDQIGKGKPIVDNVYERVVRPEGNPAAQRLMEEMLVSKDAYWRGLGEIPSSGLKLKDQYSYYDAEIKYDLDLRFGSQDLPGCRCGDVLQGKISPLECPLFGESCNPDSPRGPCMVSFEGACLAYYKYSFRRT
jgi:hydrogenase expression/formation protein HypD